jgi:oligoendopeptidase F
LFELLPIFSLETTLYSRFQPFSYFRSSFCARVFLMYPSIELPTLQSINLRCQQLLEANLNESTLEAWLVQLDQLEKYIRTIDTWTRFFQNRNVEDLQAQQRRSAFLADIQPAYALWATRLKKKFLEAPRSNNAKLQGIVKLFEASLVTSNRQTATLTAQIYDRAEEVHAILAKPTIDFRGDARSVGQIQPFLSNPDRSIRKEAYIARSCLRDTARTSLGELFLELVREREHLAATAGFDSYLAYRWKELKREDYGLAESQQLKKSVLETFQTPLAAMFSERKRVLDVDILRPWDLLILLRKDTASSFESIESVIGHAQKILTQLDSSWGQTFESMLDRNLVDIYPSPTRSSYMYADFDYLQRTPLIHAGIRPTLFGLRVLLHETGHALHYTEKAPLDYWLQSSGFEVSELIAISIELIGAYEYALYSGKPAIWSDVLSKQLEVLINQTVLSNFQEQIYIKLPTAIEQIEDMYLEALLPSWPGVAVDGCEKNIKSMWATANGFLEPMYSVEYVFARLGALQLVMRYKNAPSEIIHNLKVAMQQSALVGTKEIYNLLGLELIPSRATFKALSAWLR